MVTGCIGALGKMKRTPPSALRSSSSQMGTKSLPSAPRPCSTMMLVCGFGAVSRVISSRAMVLVSSEIQGHDNGAVVGDGQLRVHLALGRCQGLALGADGHLLRAAQPGLQTL